MSRLHIVRQSAFVSQDFYQCCQLVSVNDHILLMDDGCYNLQHPLLTEIVGKHKAVSISVLTTHAQARALSIPDHVSAITMEDMVNLTFNSDNIITWQ